MRKIYPLSFNKFAIFVLYGILSLAATTLAQFPETCELNPVPSSKYVTMGYVRLFGNNPTNLNTIQWKSYDYINVIAYPNEPDPLWNSIRRPVDPKALEPINKLIKTRDDNNPKTKILLSIRNYDPPTWPVPEDDDDTEVYGKIVEETFTTLGEFKLDGVDIEYPGMRGLYCVEGGGFLWERGEKKDEDFVEFLKNLRTKIGKKTLMVTVGSDIVSGLDEHIDFLNIETHHFSLYENSSPTFQGDFINSYPNSPFYAFKDAYGAWSAGIDSAKIFMGVDFGNTFQVVSNANIETTPSVSFNTINTINNENFLNDPVLKGLGLTRINGLCSLNTQLNGKLHLYSIPWKGLSQSILDKTRCTAIGWTRKFDDNEGNSIPSMTPWLYRVDPNTNIHQFISYEDFTSLSMKLNLFMGKIGGISISDVSNDDGSLLDFISSKEVKSPNPESPTPGTGKGDPAPSSNSTDSVNADDNKKHVDTNSKSSVGAIVGGVFGSLLGLIILGACAFIGYRYRKKPKSESFRSLLMNIPNSIKNHTTTSRNTEMTTDPSPNMFSPPATVIPVASGYVTAMFDFTGKEENDLSFKKGDKIEVLERGDGPNDWWVGRVNGAVGEFPGNYVKET